MWRRVTDVEAQSSYLGFHVKTTRHVVKTRCRGVEINLTELAMRCVMAAPPATLWDSVSVDLQSLRELLASFLNLAVV